MPIAVSCSHWNKKSDWQIGHVEISGIHLTCPLFICPSGAHRQFRCKQELIMRWQLHFPGQQQEKLPLWGCEE